MIRRVTRCQRLCQRSPYLLLGIIIIHGIMWFTVFQSTTINGNCDDSVVKEEKWGELQEKNESTKIVLPHKKFDDIPRHDKFQSKTFKKGHPKQVVILAYQRVGSSFFGKMFDLNPDVFYVYEPLDSLYQAMYGTAAGFNVPSDITSHKNGSDRILPRDEVAAVTNFLRDLLSCGFTRLPTEFFAHSFWSFLSMFMPSWTPYENCLQNHNLTQRAGVCLNKMKCPKRFGMQPWHTDNCKARLMSNEQIKLRNKLPGVNADILKALKYKACMHNVRQIAMECITMMDEKCRRTQFRVIKTVRATMESVEELISQDTNIRVIHLYRDPRPVTVSRMITQTYQGIYGMNNTVKEAKLYCSILERDLRIRRKLERKFPGVFYEVVYEDFVKYPGDYAKSVYRFLDLDVPDRMVPWVENMTRGRRVHTRQRAPRWKRVLSVAESEAIVDICKQTYELVNYNLISS